MEIKFVDGQHEKEFASLAAKYSVPMGDRDRVLLLYVLAGVNVFSRGVDRDVLRFRSSDGSVVIKEDALNHSWVTSSDGRMIRLAFHLFSWLMPTVEAGDSALNYTPIGLLSGLDERRTTVAYEALRLLRDWY